MVGEAVRLKYRCLLAKKSKKEAFTVGERDWRKKGKSGATQTHNKALMSRLVRAPSSRACERRARAEGRGVVAAPRFMEKALWGWWSLDVRGKIPQSFSLPPSLSLCFLDVRAGKTRCFWNTNDFLSWKPLLASILTHFETEDDDDEEKKDSYFCARNFFWNFLFFA